MPYFITQRLLNVKNHTRDFIRGTHKRCFDFQEYNAIGVGVHVSFVHFTTPDLWTITPRYHHSIVVTNTIFTFSDPFGLMTFQNSYFNTIELYTPQKCSFVHVLDLSRESTRSHRTGTRAARGTTLRLSIEIINIFVRIA